MDSPYASLLHTNYSPTDSESLHIKKLLTEPLAQLSRLDAEICQVQSLLNELYDKRDALNKVIDAHQALLSPVRQIPLDVIREIFLHCLPKHHNAVLSSREAPILLGHISSGWRSVALSTPRLWASFHIPTPSLMENSVPRALQHDPHRPDSTLFARKMERRCEVAKEWIDRSGECPLSVSVVMPGSPYYTGYQGSGSSFATASRKILASSRRWKNADFRATEDSFTHLQQLVEDDVLMLESLIIVNTSTRSPWDVQASLPGGQWAESSGLLSAPKLRKLSLSYLHEDLLSLPVRWSQLTHLNLDVDGLSRFAMDDSGGLEYSHVIKVLKKCPLLVSCSLCLLLKSNTFGGVPQPGFETPSSEYNLTLPLLENLSINLATRSSSEHFVGLKYLDLPILRRLEVKGLHNTDTIENYGSTLMDILSRNGATVKQLFIDMFSMTQDELIHCLELVPSVTHLHINKSNSSNAVDDQFIDRLTPSDENPDCLCPMLEEFQSKGGHANFSEVRLVSFIQKRSAFEKGGLLKRVYVRFYRYKPENLEMFFASLDIGIKLGGCHEMFDGVDDMPVDARIVVESGRDDGLAITVDVSYALNSSGLLPYFSPWDGLDLDWMHHSPAPYFTLRL